MKLLFVWPPQITAIPKHVGLPYHFVFLGEVASYLISRGEDVRVIDGVASNLSFDAIARELFNNYDLVCIFAQPHNVRQATQIGGLCRRISPNTKILYYGDLCSYIPTFFQKFPCDAIVRNGDWELSIYQYVSYLKDVRLKGELGGLIVRVGEQWIDTSPGQILKPKDWAFTDLSILPTGDYRSKFALPGGYELSLTVSKGCPFNCTYCNAVQTFGAAERRREFDDVVNYVERHYRQFDSIKLFSPTLTLDPRWMKAFAQSVIARQIEIRWCGTSRCDCLLDEEMIELMAKSGCYKIAMGVETLDKHTLKDIARTKQDWDQTLHAAIRLLNKYGIKAKASLMLGMPNQSRESILGTIHILRDFGIGVIRISAYSPYNLLKASMDLNEVETYDRRTFEFHKVAGLSYSQFLQVIYCPNQFEKILSGDVEYPELEKEIEE